MRSRRLIITLWAISLSLPLTAQWREDILSEEFQQHTIRLYQPERCSATLVRRAPLLESERAVLYLHGYNDYFFQEELAERFRAQGYNFYALDLRGYGRSMVEGEVPFQVDNLSTYFQEINAAIRVVQQQGTKSLVLMGHSTGGLILSLYCHAQQPMELVEALVLNSPFFDMNLGWFTEAIVLPIISALGGWFPNIATPASDKVGAYAQSLLRSYHGEWEYDEALKFSTSLPITARWLRAIDQGHKQLQRGLEIPYPTLVLRSDNTVKGSKWTPAHQSGDSVLDVDDIERYSAGLGHDVTLVTIEGALHDIILSSKAVRDRAYTTIFDFLE